MPVGRLPDAYSTQGLDRQVAEVLRIDCLIVAAAKRGLPPPTAGLAFEALSDASIAAADAIESCGAAPLPSDVRTELLRLHCAISDLVTTLQLYGVLMRGNTRW